MWGAAQVARHDAAAPHGVYHLNVRQRHRRVALPGDRFREFGGQGEGDRAARLVPTGALLLMNGEITSESFVAVARPIAVSGCCFRLHVRYLS